MDSTISLSDGIALEEVLALYKANSWSSAEKPGQLLPALRNSHSLVTACVAGNLAGIGNAISDGHLVVYFPHLLVHPAYQRQGIGPLLRLLQACWQLKRSHRRCSTAAQPTINTLHTTHRAHAKRHDRNTKNLLSGR